LSNNRRCQLEKQEHVAVLP